MLDHQFGFQRAFPLRSVCEGVAHPPHGITPHLQQKEQEDRAPLTQEAPKANKAKKTQKAQDRRSVESVKSLEYT